MSTTAGEFVISYVYRDFQFPGRYIGYFGIAIAVELAFFDFSGRQNYSIFFIADSAALFILEVEFQVIYVFKQVRPL